MAMNVLIVDDSTLTRKAIRRTIGMIDLEVDEIYEAENGRHALEILESQSVDMVLADLNMPEMGGIEMIYHMRGNEATKYIPVVVVSTESSTARIKGLLVHGAEDYLHKPFTPEKLKSVITRTVRSVAQ